MCEGSAACFRLGRDTPIPLSDWEVEADQRAELIRPHIDKMWLLLSLAWICSQKVAASLAMGMGTLNDLQKALVPAGMTLLVQHLTMRSLSTTKVLAKRTFNVLQNLKVRRDIICRLCTMRFGSTTKVMSKAQMKPL